MRSFYISPHFDDGIGSCGGIIHRDVKSGETVFLVTVFSGVKEPFSTLAIDLHNYWNLENPFTDRKNENVNACKSLGIDNIDLDFYDAIYRTDKFGEHIYKKQKELFERIKNDDKYLINNIYNKIEKIVTKQDCLYFPYGIGKHVDHMIVTMVGDLFRKQGYSIKYYKDFTYKEKPPKKNFELSERIIRLNKEEIFAKATAMSEYKSQLKMLFGEENKIIDYFQLRGEEIYYE